MEKETKNKGVFQTQQIKMVKKVLFYEDGKKEKKNPY